MFGGLPLALLIEDKERGSNAPAAMMDTNFKKSLRENSGILFPKTLFER
jgi:hypothetical protein